MFSLHKAIPDEMKMWFTQDWYKSCIADAPIDQPVAIND